MRCVDKKLSCRRETARCFVSLNISLSHSRSLKITGNGFSPRPSLRGIIFRDTARYWSKSRFFIPHLHCTPPLGGPRPNIGITATSRFTSSASPVLSLFTSSSTCQPISLIIQQSFTLSLQAQNILFNKAFPP